FTTRATRDFSLPTPRRNPCGGSVITAVRRGSGVIQQLARHFVSLIPARKSCLSPFQASDLTKQKLRKQNPSLQLQPSSCPSWDLPRRRLRDHCRRRLARMGRQGYQVLTRRRRRCPRRFLAWK